jgi:putative FmdB family regulatory protein
VPIYEYQCDACGHQLEALQKISDPLLTTCPECGADSLRKRVSAAAFRLKGGGWYETDFKNKQPGKKASSGAGPADKTADSGGKEDGKKSDAKTGDSGSGKGDKAAAS